MNGIQIDSNQGCPLGVQIPLFGGSNPRLVLIMILGLSESVIVNFTKIGNVDISNMFLTLLSEIHNE